MWILFWIFEINFALRTVLTAIFLTNRCYLVVCWILHLHLFLNCPSSADRLKLSISFGHNPSNVPWIPRTTPCIISSASIVVQLLTYHHCIQYVQTVLNHFSWQPNWLVPVSTILWSLHFCQCKTTHRSKQTSVLSNFTLYAPSSSVKSHC